MKNYKLLRAHSRLVFRPLVCAIVIALVCAGTAFAEEEEEPEVKEKKESGPSQNAITLDLMPLVKGTLMSDSDNDVLFVPLFAAYERRVAPHMSIGGNLDIVFGKYGEYDGKDIPYMYFSVAGAWRYYPMSEQIEKFFVGAMLGVNVQSIDGKTKEENGGFTGLLIGVNFGYRALLGKTFFLEPSMSYVYSKASSWALGWQGGFRLGVAL